MAYEPIPFVAPLIDQTSQRLKLADLLYQANMARSQAELQRQMQVAQMIAQFGQNIGAGIESWMDRQQRERALAIQAERENRLASAQEAQNQLMLDRMAAEDRRNTLALQQDLYEKARGGTEAWKSDAAATFGPYASLMQESPELTATRQEITPAQTMQIGPSAMPAQPDVLESRPMNLAVLAGTAEPVQTTYEGYLTKPFSAAETKAMEEQAAESSRRNALANFSAKMSDPSVSDADKMADADRLVALGILTPAQKTAMFPVARPVTEGQLRAEDFKRWQEKNPNGTFMEYEAERARRIRPAGEDGADKNKIQMIGGRPYRESADGQMVPVSVAPIPVPSGIASLSEPMRNIYEEIKVGLPGNRTQTFEDSINAAAVNNPQSAEYRLVERYRQTHGDSEQRKKAEGRKTAMNALRGIINDVKSVDTGLMRGTAEAVANMFGKSSDPELQKLRNKLLMFTQVYRRSMTGAAFSAGESKEYKDLMADIANGKELNLARAEAFLNVLENQERDYWDALGGGTYDAVRRLEMNRLDAPTFMQDYGGNAGVSYAPKSGSSVFGGK